MRARGNHGRECLVQKLHEVLEGMFAEACLPGYTGSEETEKICSCRARELCSLVKEMVEVYGVAAEWERAGVRKAYATQVCIDIGGVKKRQEWQRMTSEEAAPQPHAGK